jgi:predicted GNAT family acetyltransferase
MSDAAPVVVADDAPHTRYTAEVGGRAAGFAAYVLRPGAIAFVHTEVDPAFGGRGVGGSLVRGALDDARARGLAVLPFCPFVRAYVQGHREYADLVPAAARPRFGL